MTARNPTSTEMKARISALEAFIKLWAFHDRPCAYLKWEKSREDCDCGYTEAKKELRRKP